MQKYHVEGWVQITIPIDKKVDAPTQHEAIRKVLTTIENYTNGDINNQDLTATEV